MKRNIIEIDQNLCNGCGLCVSGCAEGAIQMINGKAYLINDRFCDGLGACIGHCPVGAIKIELKEAGEYDEKAVLDAMIPKGVDVIKAHLKHLEAHGEKTLVTEALDYLKTKNIEISKKHSSHFGCPSVQEQSFIPLKKTEENQTKQHSQLQQWPIQLHLLTPYASFLKNSDLVLAADCVAFSLGDFHQTWLIGKTLAIACPKLDSNQQSYLDKLTEMIDSSNLNTITVMIMEVPCCRGLLKLAMSAVSNAKRKIPIKSITVGIKGDILKENWVNL
ncbi:4Fe-4S ferredoxin [bacterium]|nr:4Fe-4S ferredoxin [bacterium]